MKRILVIFGGGTMVSSFYKRATGPDANAFQSLHNYVEKFKIRVLFLIFFIPG